MRVAFKHITRGALHAESVRWLAVAIDSVTGLFLATPQYKSSGGPVKRKLCRPAASRIAGMSS